MGIPAYVRMINFVIVVMIPTQTNGHFVLIVTGLSHLDYLDITYVSQLWATAMATLFSSFQG